MPTHTARLVPIAIEQSALDVLGLVAADLSQRDPEDDNVTSGERPP